VGAGMAWVDYVAGLGTAPGGQRHGLGEDNIVAGSRTTLRAWGWLLRGRRRHQLGSVKMAARKGARPWSGTMAQRIWGGLNDGTEALGRTRRRHGLRGGRRRCGLQGNFRREIFAA
jgi:hypothetical protein